MSHGRITACDSPTVADGSLSESGRAESAKGDEARDVVRTELDLVSPEAVASLVAAYRYLRQIGRRTQKQEATANGDNPGREAPLAADTPDPKGQDAVERITL